MNRETKVTLLAILGFMALAGPIAVGLQQMRHNRERKDSQELLELARDSAVVAQQQEQSDRKYRRNAQVVNTLASWYAPVVPVYYGNKPTTVPPPDIPARPSRVVRDAPEVYSTVYGYVPLPVTVQPFVYQTDLNSLLIHQAKNVAAMQLLGVEMEQRRVEWEKLSQERERQRNPKKE